MEKAKRVILISSVTMKNTVGVNSVKPLEFLRKMAHTTSKKPAAINANQFIEVVLILFALC